MTVMGHGEDVLCLGLRAGPCSGYTPRGRDRCLWSLEVGSGQRRGGGQKAPTSGPRGRKSRRCHMQPRRGRAVLRCALESC